jgi:hypothetical protein
LAYFLNNAAAATRAPQVIKERLPYLATWAASKNMYGALTELKTMISSATRAQPQSRAPRRAPRS